MIKKSKKIIASLLMTLSLVSIFPITNAFAMTQEETDFIASCTELKNDRGGYDKNEKDGKYYVTVGGDLTESKIAKSMFVGDYYAQADGSLIANAWVYSNKIGHTEKTWRYIGADYKCFSGFQTVNGVRYYFTESIGSPNGDLGIGWFRPRDGEWHYSYPDGSMREGWVNTNGKWYYIYSDGTMAKSTTTPDGYHVNSRGVCVS